MPIATVALLAVVSGQPEIAVGVAFATSVASVSLVVGVITLSTPPDVLVVADRRRWAFVLPAALLAMLAGFRAELTLTHAAIFVFEGIAVLWLWRDRTEALIDGGAPPAANAASRPFDASGDAAAVGVPACRDRGNCGNCLRRPDRRASGISPIMHWSQQCFLRPR